MGLKSDSHELLLKPTPWSSLPVSGIIEDLSLDSTDIATKFGFGAITLLVLL